MSSSQSCLRRNSVQNAPIEKFTALTVTLFVKNHKFDPVPKKMSSSQSCSHQHSVQNAPIESSTALTATLFVKNPKFDPDPKKTRHHTVVRTEILCRMHRSRAPQLSRQPFSWKISNLTPIQFSNPNLLLGTSYYMPSVAGVFFFVAGQILTYFLGLPTSCLHLLYPNDLYRIVGAVGMGIMLGL